MTAAQWFDWICAKVLDEVPPDQNERNAKAAMLSWLSVSDPLRIAEGRECACWDIVRPSGGAG